MNYMEVIEKILGDKEPKPNPQVWYERAGMFLSPKEAKYFCEKLETFCRVDTYEQDKRCQGAFNGDEWPLTGNDFEYLASTMDYLWEKGFLSK